MTEGSPLLDPGSADSADTPLAAAATAAENSPASPLPSVSEEEPSAGSAHSAHDFSAHGLRGGRSVPGAVRKNTLSYLWDMQHAIAVASSFSEIVKTVAVP